MDMKNIFCFSIEKKSLQLLKSCQMLHTLSTGCVTWVYTFAVLLVVVALCVRTVHPARMLGPQGGDGAEKGDFSNSVEV